MHTGTWQPAENRNNHHNTQINMLSLILSMPVPYCARNYPHTNGSLLRNWPIKNVLHVKAAKHANISTLTADCFTCVSRCNFFPGLVEMLLVIVLSLAGWVRIRRNQWRLASHTIASVMYSIHYDLIRQKTGVNTQPIKSRVGCRPTGGLDCM